jgi:hypothetical protein
MNKLGFKHNKINSKNGLHKLFLKHVAILNLISYIIDMILKDSQWVINLELYHCLFWNKEWHRI